jgi:hypothetical protein
VFAPAQGITATYQHDLLRECKTHVLSIEIIFIHIPVEAGMAAARIGVLDWLLGSVGAMNSKYPAWQARTIIRVPL